MTTKICRKCQQEKETSEFYRKTKNEDVVRGVCKICINKQNTLYSQKNKEKINKIKKKYVINNKEKVKLSKKKWFEKNPNYKNEWVVKNYKNDYLFRLVTIVRARTRLFFKSKNLKKNSKTFEIIGCSPEYLKEHIEKQFTEGMSWDLIGKYIHIDHIIPLSSAKTEEEIYKLSHYTNLQPLWAEENLKKSNKILN